MYSDKYLDKEIERLKTGKKTKLLVILVAFTVFFLLKYMDNGFDNLSVSILTAAFVVTLYELQIIAIVKRITTKD